MTSERDEAISKIKAVEMERDVAVNKARWTEEDLTVVNEKIEEIEAERDSAKDK